MSEFNPTIAPSPSPKKGWFRRNMVTLIAAGAALVVGVGVGSISPSTGSSPRTKIIVQTAEPQVVEKTVETGSPEICVDVAKDLYAMTESFAKDVALPYNEALIIISTEATALYPSVSEIDRATDLVIGASTTVEGFTTKLNGGLVSDYKTCIGE